MEENKDIENPTESSPSQRKLKNFVLDIKAQSRVALRVILAALITALILFSILFYKLSQLTQVLYGDPNVSAETHVAVYNTLFSIFIYSGLMVLAVIAVSYLYGFIMAHRYVGPRQVILQFIEDLKKGDYTNQRELREKDELHDVMKSLHELRDQLKQK